MSSTEFVELQRRVKKLLGQFLPPENPLGFYTPEQEDCMRALRMLVHAEIEAYLETICRQLLVDLEEATRAAKRVRSIFASWAHIAVKECHSAIQSNNGVKDSDIKKMFSHLGVTQEHYDSVSPLFLDKMRNFGKQRGDVAHQSALRTSLSLNRKREEAAIDEVMNFIANFDKFLIRHRLKGFH